MVETTPEAQTTAEVVVGPFGTAVVDVLAATVDPVFGCVGPFGSWHDL